MASENKLLITVDSSKAVSSLDKLDKKLDSVEKSGNELIGVSTNLSKKVDDTGKSFLGFNNVSEKTMGNIKTLAAGMGVLVGAIGAAAGALAAYTVTYANNARELQNQATLADAGIVEFQRMAVAAERYGVTQEQLSDKLKDFNEKLGEFTTSGKGEGVDAFEMLKREGLMTTEQIKKLALEMQKASGPQALQMYVNELEKAGVSQEQMSFYLENMGNDFTKLIPILVNGGKEMNYWADAAQRAGLIMDEEATQKALKLEEQIYMLEIQLKGARNTIMQEVVPALLNIITAFTDGQTEGSGFDTIAKGIAITLKHVAAVAALAANGILAIGKAYGGVAAIGTTIASEVTLDPTSLIKSVFKNREQIKNIAGNMISDAKGIYEQTKKQLDLIYAEQPKLPPAPKPSATSNTPTSGRNKGLDEELKKWNKGDAGTRNAKGNAERAAREIEQAREKVQREYADKLTRIEIDLQKDLEDIRKANLGSAKSAEYIALAKDRAELEKAQYKLQMESNLNQFKQTEQQKLEYKNQLDELSLKLNKDMTAEMRSAAIASLKEQYAYETQQIQLNKDKRLFAAEEVFMSESDAIKKRYELERQEILANKSIDENERSRLLSANTRSEGMAENDRRKGIWDDFTSAFGGGQTEYQRLNEINKAAMDEGLINEQEYLMKRLQMQAEFGGEYVAGLSSTMKTAFGEQSAAYRASFALEKGFTVAVASLKMQENISKAMATGFPQNIPLIASAVSQGMQIFSAISSIKGGFADGGYTGAGGKYDVAGLVHKGEVVWSQQDIKRAGGVSAVESMRKGGFGDSEIIRPNVNITVNTPEGYTATQNVGKDGTITIDVVDAWNHQLLGNANSKTRKAMAQNTTAGARRG